MNGILTFPTEPEALKYRQRPSLAPQSFPRIVAPVGGDRANVLAWDTLQGTSGTLLENHQTDNNLYWLKHVNNASVGTVQLTGVGACRKTSTGTFGIYILPNMTMSDCVVSARVKFTAAPAGTFWAGICARFQADANSGYVFYYSTANGFLLRRFDAGSAVTLVTYAAAYPGSPSNTDDKTYNSASSERDIRLECIGRNIRAYVDGVLVASAVDSTYQFGCPGIYTAFATADATGVHLSGWSVSLPYAPVGDAGGTSFYRGGLSAVRSNGCRIEAGASQSKPSVYQWYRSLSRGATASPANILPGQNSERLDDRSALPGTTYYYRLGVAQDGGSALSPDWPVTTRATTDKVAVCEGNSLTYGVGSVLTIPAESYPTRLAVALGAPWATVNLGSPSSHTRDLISIAQRRTDPWNDVNLARSVLLHWEGTNDLLVNDGATAWANTVIRLQRAREAGWQTIAVGTVIDRQQTGVPADMATRIADYNTALAGAWATYADILMDFMAETELQDSTDTTYFQTDKVHLKAAGYQIVADVAAAALSGL